MIRFHIKRIFSFKQLILYYAIVLLLYLLLSVLFDQYGDTLTKANQIQLGVISEDTHNLSQVLLDSFSNNPQFTALFSVSIGPKDEIANQFAKGSLDAYILIPKGFTEGLLTYNNQNITLYGKLENPAKNQLIAAMISGYAQYIDAANAATWSLYFTMKDANLPSEALTANNNAFSFEMISATLGRGKYFTLAPQSELPLLSSSSYFSLALPLALVTLSTLSAGTMAIKQRRQAHYKRLVATGYPLWRHLLEEYFAHWLYGIFLSLPIFVLILLSAQDYWIQFSLVILISWFLWPIFWRILSLLTSDHLSFIAAATAIGFITIMASGGFIPFLLLPAWLKSLGMWQPNMQLMRLGTQALEVQSFFVPLLLILLLGLITIYLEARLITRSLTHNEDYTANSL